MKLMRTAATILALSLAIASLSAMSTASAQAPVNVPEGRVLEPQKHVLVFGSSGDITINAELPPKCAGADATVGFFKSGGAAKVNAIDQSLGVAQVKVPVTGLVNASLRVPASGSLKTVWPGVTSSCLANPVVSVGKPVLFGVRDEAANPGGAASFVIPAFSLNYGGPAQVVKATLTVLVDGNVCRSVNLESQANKDSEGNVWIHVGRADQPKGCAKPGATVSFRYPNGDVLFETREYVPGVTQPLENLAPAAGPATGPGPVPAAPGAGTGSATASQEPGWGGAEAGLRLAIGASCIVLAALVAWAGPLRRRVSARRNQ